MSSTRPPLPMPIDPSRRRVIVESPYAGDVRRNVRYARACLLDCLERGEVPFASHLLFPQVLDDADPLDRELGIRAGLYWAVVADAVAVYTDLGISAGMRASRRFYERSYLPIERRSLGGRWAK